MNIEDRMGGVLIPIGGAEDRGEELEPKLPFEQKGVLKHVIDEAKGAESRVVVVTSASNIPDEVAAAYRHGFERLSIQNMEHFHIKTKAECEESELLETFGKADVVFFSGGNQAKLPRYIRNTRLHDQLRARFRKEKLVIAGTSAGAMAMSEFMVAGGSASEAFVKGAIKMRVGLSFIPELIIDTHFVRRGRFGRLAEAVSKHPECVGIGLAEDTGVVIKNNEEFRVIGSGMCIVMDPRTVTHNNHQILENGTPMSIRGLTTHLLSNGDQFDMRSHEVEVLPIDSEFI